jgi:hypothetical protein
MNSDQNKPPLPAKPVALRAQIQEGSEVQAVVGYLPQTESIQDDARIAIAESEGFDPLAIELALGLHETSTAYKFLLLGLTILAAALVIFAFPIDRFFKPATEDLATMSIGDPFIQDNQAHRDVFATPWLRVLLEMDRLYFQEGKLTEAIQVAESNLERVPEKNWEDWKKVHYRYWELLSDAGRTHALKTATKSYLQLNPDDPFANYYAAQAFLAATERMPSFNREMQAAYRLEAETLIEQTDRVCNTLNAQRKFPAKKEKKAFLSHLYQRMRLQQAKLFILIWRLGGYKEDNHPDVVFRDKALAICDSNELSNLKEAKELKVNVYTHILDRWYWFEGQQVIQGIKQKRRKLVEALKTLRAELKDAEKL